MYNIHFKLGVLITNSWTVDSGSLIRNHLLLLCVGGISHLLWAEKSFLYVSGCGYTEEIPCG